MTMNDFGPKRRTLGQSAMIRTRVGIGFETVGSTVNAAEAAPKTAAFFSACARDRSCAARSRPLDGQAVILRADSNAEYLIQQPGSGVAAPIRRDLSETDDMSANFLPARGLIFGMSFGTLFWLVILLVWTLIG